MKAALIVILLAGCSALPETYCKAGYAHSYSYAGGYRQIWSEHGKGVPCP